MQRRRYFEKYTSRGIFIIMREMLNAEFCTYFGDIREDDYEWVIGRDVWDRIIKNVSNNRNNSCNIEVTISNYGDTFYKIFDIEVTISTNDLNAITLRKKDKRRNEMPTNYSGAFKAMSRAYPKPIPTINNVIFNDPATIVFWRDGSKTVVKCQDGEIYDPEKGLAMAISKKALGNKGNYCEVFKKWLPEDEENVAEFRFDSSDFEARINSLIDSINSHFPLKKEDLMKKDE